MKVRAALIGARTLAGLSQEKLAVAAKWDGGHVSKFENGTRGASIEKIDAWLEACGVKLVPVLESAPNEAELNLLPEGRRELMLRLIRLMPNLTDARVSALNDLVDQWERVARTEAMNQVSRASSS